jgi:aspartyl-tRNA synthetase
MELAWTDEAGIMGLVEGLVRAVFADVAGVDLPAPFPRLTYAHALRRYGTDKPDLRYGLEMGDVTAAVEGCGFRVFADAPAVKGLRVPEGARVSNSRVKPKGDVCGEAQAAGAAGLVAVRIGEGGAWEGAKAAAEGLSEAQRAAVAAEMQAQPVSAGGVGCAARNRALLVGWGAAR